MISFGLFFSSMDGSNSLPHRQNKWNDIQSMCWVFASALWFIASRLSNLCVDSWLNSMTTMTVWLIHPTAGEQAETCNNMLPLIIHTRFLLFYVLYSHTLYSSAEDEHAFFLVEKITDNKVTRSQLYGYVFDNRMSFVSQLYTATARIKTNKNSRKLAAL